MTPENRNPVRRYFDAEAGDYSHRSGAGIWKHLREREAAALFDLLQPRPGEAILDAGCGSGFYTEMLLRMGARTTALDLSPAMLDALRQRHPDVPVIEADLEDVHLEPVYDRIVCAGALEFGSDPALAIRNLAAGLRPDGPGTLVILLPRLSLAGLGYQIFHQRHGMKIHLFRRADVQRFVRETGSLEIETIRKVTFNFAVRARRK